VRWPIPSAMKVLLIQPPVRDFYQTRIRTQPIGLAYLAASLRLQGFETTILDCQTGRQRSIPLPPQFSHLHEIYPSDDRSPFRLYSSFYHFGMGWEEIRREIDAFKPAAVGIASLFTPYHGEALEVARIVKEGDPFRIVIMGGPHVSGDPEGVLNSGLVDYVVLGEGEVRFPRLLKAIQEKRLVKDMEGIGYWNGGKIRINPVEGFIDNVNSIPWPARDLLDPDRYRIGKRRSTMLITSRGCPHQCVYCSARLVMGHRFRPRSPEAVVEEMEDCQNRYNIASFDIEDDNFTFDLDRAKHLMHLIIQTFGERTLYLSAMNGISFASLDLELLGLMRRAGFGAVNLSFVSHDGLTRRRMKRPGAGPAYFEEIVESAVRLGFTIVAYAIFGLPGQTLSEMVDTLIYLMARRVLIGPSIYYPSPGTALMEHCRREGLLPPDMSQWRSSAFPVETKDFDRLDLATLFRLTRLINFLKGKMSHGDMGEGISWRDLFLLSKDSGQEGPDSWPRLLQLLFDERSFFGFARGPTGLSVKRIPSSQRVVNLFLDKALDKVVLRE
jgi:anaerobic magnesium-protoporphyrin IX monomethyl ester cyclase